MTKDLTSQLENKARYSPFLWAATNVVLPNRTGQWDFSERLWQIPILEDSPRRLAYQPSSSAKRCGS